MLPTGVSNISFTPFTSNRVFNIISSLSDEYSRGSWCFYRDWVTNVAGDVQGLNLWQTSMNSPPRSQHSTFNVILRCPPQDGICMCEEGFTEVLSPTGQLDQCAPIPILEIPTAGDKKGDVKTSRAINPTLPTTILPGRTGRTWYLQPYGPGQVSDPLLLLKWRMYKIEKLCFVAVMWKAFNLLSVVFFCELTLP